jgi:hypothetical protein
VTLDDLTKAYTERNVRDFPVLSRVVPNQLSFAGKNLFMPGQGEFCYSDIPAGYRKIANLFLQCM